MSLTLGSYRTEGGIWTACALAAALLAPPAAAQSQDGPLILRLTSSLAWDANLFRLPDAAPDPQAAQGKPGKSDRIKTTSLVLRFDKGFSQQHFLVELAQTATRYDKFSSLDRDAPSYRAIWQWHLSPRISGTLSADRSESEVSFEDALGQQRIVAVNTTRNITVDGWLFGGWHLLAGASETERKNSAVFIAQPDIRQTGAEAGLKYVAESQSSITFTTRSRRGTNSGQAVDFVNFIDNGFSERDSELAAAWIVSGRSTLNGRLTRIERRHENIPQRDFSGTAGELRYAWTPLGRLSLNFSALRSIAPFTSGTSATYRVEDTLAFAPSWQVSDKTSVRMSASRRVSDYLGPVGPVAGPLRRDVFRSVELAASWLPHRKVTLGASLRRDLRTSNDAAFKFDDTVAAVSASLAF